MKTQPRQTSRFLLLVVFLAGVGTLGIEMVMPRLLAPFFGTSQPIWAIVIGMTLIYLTAGYWLGGRLADHMPHERLLYQLIAWAGLTCGFIPLLADPILRIAQQSLTGVAAGGFIGALVGVILLFCLPVVLMATVGPFAIRLHMRDEQRGIEEVGRTAGTISALSTLGSIVGAFLPTLVLIPWVGTQWTIYLFAFFLVTLGLMGLRDWRFIWMVGLIVGISMYTLSNERPIKMLDCPRCWVVDETESRYNYIQVIEQETVDEYGLPDMRVNLVLNEGHAVHSTYRLRFRRTGDPRDLLTSGPWDYFSVAPYFYPDRSPESVMSMALLGSAAGTVPKQFLAIYGEEARVDAVEIDPRITEMGRAYFDMEDQRIPTYTVHTQDARYWLASTDRHYDIIGMDAYHQPYIPFHLTTVEFFQEAKEHLTEQGVVVVNAGRPPSGDRRLEHVLATTMRAVFPQVFLMDTRLPRSASALIVGVNRPVGDGVANFQANAQRMRNQTLRTVMHWALTDALHPVREFDPAEVAMTPAIEPFTDDHAPVERLIDSVIFDEATRFAP
jgi:predicted membrane-bound spermidine synthase